VYDRTSKEVMESYATEVERWLDGKREALGIENTYSWFSEGQGAMTRAYLPKGTPREAIERLREELKKDLPVIPGVTLDVGDRNWWQRREGDERVVNVALHGDDPEYLLILALMAEERLASVEDAVDVMGPSLAGQKELRLLVDGDRARSLGLTPEDVSRVVGGTFRERRLRRFRGEGREMEVVMRVPERLLYGVAALQALPIPVEHGTVPLSSVAELQVGRTPPWIHRSDRMTTQMVGVKFDRSVTTDEGKARVEKVMKSFELPPGYSWDWGRWGEEHDEALGVMLQGVLLSLVLVVLLMAACFESLLQPLAIVITLPLAFFGAFWALWALGYDLDVVAFMGVIILIGVVVNNGIVMVDHVNQLRAKGLSRDAALLQGCSDRFRPVLMTALTTLVGLVPLALSSATVAQVYIDSLAVAVIGGLTTSTIFTLLALPVWQSAIEDLGAFLVRLLPRRVLAAPSVATPDASLPPTFGVTE
jgi:HAE1 family hydrophobic/amphiphilic exporter-1